MECAYDVFTNRPIEEDLKGLLQGYRVYVPEEPLSGSRAWEIAKRSRVYIDWFDPVTSDMLRDKGCLQVIIARSSGYDHIDVEAAESLGVCVANQPEIITEAVAEFAVGGILAVLKRIVARHNYFPQWASKGWPTHLSGFLLRGRSLGLLGAGRIGQSIALKLKALGAGKILYYSRTTKPALDALGGRRVPLEELFEHSQILVNSLPLTRDTRAIVTYSLLTRLPVNAVYVNVGRGGTEEAGAVERVARERPDLGFVLDVHPVEPVPGGSDRTGYVGDPRFVLAPHMAGFTVESKTGTTLLALLQARDFLRWGCVWNPVVDCCRRCGWGAPELDKVIDMARRIARG